MKNKYIIRIAKCAFLLLVILGTYHVLNYIASDDSKVMTRITFHDFYEAEKMDGIFIGPSHVYAGLNMVELSELTGKEYYTISTSSQETIASYYALEEALEQHDLEEVYFEISPSRMAVQSAERTTKLYIVTDYLKNSVRKWINMCEIYGMDGIINGALRLRRNFDSLSKNPVNWNTLNRKDEMYWNYETSVERYGYDYVGRGTWIREGSIAETPKLHKKTENMELYEYIDSSRIGQEEWEYVEKIVDICRENEVKLTFFVMPFSDYWLEGYTNYTEFMSYMQAYAQENGVTWLDMNLASREKLALDDSAFSDLDHLNRKGNAIVTRFLAEYINGKAGDCFYQNIEEKKAKDPSQSPVYGIEYECLFYDGAGMQVEKFDDTGYAKYIFKVVGKPDFEEEIRVFNSYTEPEGEILKGANFEVTPEGENSYSIKRYMDNYTRGLTVEVYEKGTDNCVYSAKL